MNNTATKSNGMTSAGLRLIKFYIAVAFVVWKQSCLYIQGDAGLSSNFGASFWSLAVGWGYAFGVTVLLGHAFLQLKSKQYQGLTSSLIFAGFGLLFLVLGTGIPRLTVSSVGSMAGLGMNALMLYYSFKGLRHFKARAFTLWVWGYSINLIGEIGMKFYVAANTPAMMGGGNPGWFWNLVQDFGLSALHAEWLLEFYWLGHIVSGVLIAAGLILLVRQAKTEDSRPLSTDTAKYVAMGVLLMLIGIYPSLACFGSPGFVTTCVANIVILCFSLSVCRRPRCLCFALWAWASGVTLALTVGGQFHRNWGYPPGWFDSVILELMVLGGLIAGILWVVGLMLALRQLTPGKLSDEAKTETIPEVALIPNPPGWTKNRLAIILGMGLLAICIVWLRNNDPSQVLSLEPKYEGQTLSYWMDHWYLNPWGGTVNAEAQAAVKSMGVKAVPYLVDWIGRPYNSYPGLNYPDRALKGFEVLGPVAKPAVPKLIKMIGRGDYPIRALLCIGADAVPALADKYVETLAYTNPPMMNWRDSRSTTSPARIQEGIIQTLSQMGTNAEAAVPALIKGVRSQTPWTRTAAAMALGNVGQNQPDTVIPVLMNALTNTDPSTMSAVAGALASVGKSRPNIVVPVLISTITNASTDAMSQGVIAGALASVGHDRPATVVPVLVQVFTHMNSNAVQPAAGRRGMPFRPDFYNRMTGSFDYDFGASPQCRVADALATFGSQATEAVPCLLLAGESTDANLRSHVAVAVQKIAPLTPAPLAPLIRNLTEKDAQVRRQALWTLESLGTNAAEALPMLVQTCLHDSDTEVRKGAMECISKIGQINDDIIHAMGENLTSADSSIDNAAYGVLAGFADRSKAAFVLLMKAMRTCPDGQTRQQIRYCLQSAVSRSTTILNECVFGINPDDRYEALQLSDQFEMDFSDSRVPLHMMLRDENPEARILATNMLIQLDSARYGRPVAELLIRGGNLNATNDQGLAALHVSAASHQAAAITALLAAGADPNIKDNQGRTAAHLLLTEKWPWEGVVATLSALVKGGANLSVSDNNGKTPLHYLAAVGSVSPFFFMRGITDIFESSKMDIEARDNDGNTPLVIAAKTGTTDVFGWLINKGANLDATNNAGESARLLAARDRSPFTRPGERSAETDIFQAVHENNVDAATRLLNADPQLANQTNQFRQTPLREAVLQHQTNMISFLETHGAKWDEGSAVMAGRTDVLKSIIQNTPTAVSTKVQGKGLIHIAAANGDVDMLKILIAASADLQAKDRWGLSPLGYALIKNHQDVQALLLRHGAKENIIDAVYADDLKTVTALLAQDKSLIAQQNQFKTSSLEIAAAAGYVDILKLLLKNSSAKADCQSAIPLAAFYNQTNILALLIKLGVNVNQTDGSGFAPLHWATLRGAIEAVNILLQNRADPNLATAQIGSFGGMPGSLFYARDHRTLLGETPLHLAVLCGDTNEIQLLLKFGANVNAVNGRMQTPLDLADGMPPMNFFGLSMVQHEMLFLLEPLGVNQAPVKTPGARRDGQKAAVALIQAAGGKHSQNRQPFGGRQNFP